MRKATQVATTRAHSYITHHAGNAVNTIRHPEKASFLFILTLWVVHVARFHDSFASNTTAMRCSLYLTQLSKLVSLNVMEKKRYNRVIWDTYRQSISEPLIYIMVYLSSNWYSYYISILNDVLFSDPMRNHAVNKGFGCVQPVKNSWDMNTLESGKLYWT